MLDFKILTLCRMKIMIFNEIIKKILKFFRNWYLKLMKLLVFIYLISFFCISHIKECLEKRFIHNNLHMQL